MLMQMGTCTWCGTGFTEHRPLCAHCGGPLPPPPGDDPGPPPPPPPRRLPAGFSRRVRFTRNVPTMVGAIFLAVGLLLAPGMAALAADGGGPAVVAGLLVVAALLLSGGPLLYLGLRRARRTLDAFQIGVAVLGRISDVYRDESISINGRSPVAIEYEFEVRGQVHGGKAQTWDGRAMGRRPGQPLHVLYVAGSPERSTVYPPIR